MIAPGLSVLLLSAYVTHVVVRDAPPACFLLLPALALSLAAFLPYVWPVRLVDLWRTTGLLQHVGGVAVACAVRELATYAVAFAVAFLFTALVTIAHERSLVQYDARTVGFSVSSAALYATLRVVARAVVRATDVGEWFALLLPFVASTVETLGMYLSVTNRFYSFPSHSYPFAVYSTLKASLFLALPRAEDQWLRRYVASS